MFAHVRAHTGKLKVLNSLGGCWPHWAAVEVWQLQDPLPPCIPCSDLQPVRGGLPVSLPFSSTDESGRSLRELECDREWGEGSIATGRKVVVGERYVKTKVRVEREKRVV